MSEVDLPSPEMRQTTDFNAMRELALRSGLEDGSFDNYIVAYGYYVGPDLVACAALRPRDGVLTVESLAVSDAYRGKGLGRSLVSAIEREARKRGAAEVWAIARAPEFFERIGYSRVEPGHSRGPSLKGCESCQQFRRNCDPAVVRKTL